MNEKQVMTNLTAMEIEDNQTPSDMMEVTMNLAKKFDLPDICLAVIPNSGTQRSSL